MTKIELFICRSAFLMVAILLCSSEAMAQQAGAPMFAPPGGSAIVTQPPMTVNPSSEPSPAADDPSLTTHETAVECAMALIVESAGERHA
jgi:hypothetical protein